MGGYFLLPVDQQYAPSDRVGLKYGIDRDEQDFNISVSIRCGERVIFKEESFSVDSEEYQLICYRRCAYLRYRPSDFVR